MTLRTLVIVGVGLIGGSIALAARSRRVAKHIIGVGPSAFHLEQARQRGMLDEWHHELPGAARDADVVVVCAPVDQIAYVAMTAVCHGREDTLVTDVGSTKASIVGVLRSKLPQGSCFVGGHPLAGSERSGPQFADVRMFENRLVVLTPDDWFDPRAAERAADFWQALGARVKMMTPAEHDRAVAMTSHLPHMVAAALATILPPELQDLAASGFRDTTRVAGGDPALWSAIFCQNNTAVLDALELFISKLKQFAATLTDSWGLDSITDSEALLDLLTQAKRNRDALGS
jgi:prephenate dehydrogenase